MPQRHPNTITSTSQPNPCLSHAPNSWIRCCMRKSPRLVLFSPERDGNEYVSDGHVTLGRGRSLSALGQKRTWSSASGCLLCAKSSHRRPAVELSRPIDATASASDGC